MLAKSNHSELRRIRGWSALVGDSELHGMKEEPYASVH